jgi:hypothetical protein
MPVMPPGKPTSGKGARPSGPPEPFSGPRRLVPTVAIAECVKVPLRPLERRGSGYAIGYFAAAFWVARVAALATAFKEAVTMSLSMPTP